MIRLVFFFFWLQATTTDLASESSHLFHKRPMTIRAPRFRNAIPKKRGGKAEGGFYCFWYALAEIGPRDLSCLSDSTDCAKRRK